LQRTRNSGRRIPRKKLKRIRNDLKKYAFFHWSQGDGWKRPKWTYLEPKRGEQKKRLTPIFFKTHEYLWDHKCDYHEVKELMERKGLPRITLSQKQKNLMPVLVVVDTALMARELNTSVANVRKILRAWCSGPLKQLGMTGPKNTGGKMIIAIGWYNEVYWTKVPFFTEKRWKQWLRGVMIQSSEKKRSLF